MRVRLKSGSIKSSSCRANLEGLGDSWRLHGSALLLQLEAMMERTFWLPQTEAALAQVEGR